MRRKNLIRTVNKLRKKYRLTGEGGVFEIVGLLANKSTNTVQTYYYSDLRRPVSKGKRHK